MTRHIIRRLIQAIPTIFGVTILSYMIMTAAPGGPAELLTFNPAAVNDDGTNIIREQIIERWSLDDPWPIQYLTWLAGNDWMWWKNECSIDETTGEEVCDQRYVSYGILRGDFGTSIQKRLPVSDLILQRLPATIELGISSLLVALLLGVPIGIMAAVWRGGIFDNATRILAVVGNAIPNFWFGLILLLVFAFTLDLLPSGQQCDKTKYSRIACSQVPITERLNHLILPTIVLAYGGVAGYSRYMRTSMLDTINSDYVRTARAKGLSSRTVWLQHAARNALIPLATFLGPALVSILGGAVVTEQIFSWPGLGQLFIQSISARDYPIVMASVFISAILTIVAFIISDILYAVFDPRIRF